jgi:DNA-binding XRE family transcriptional regulator
MRLRSEMIRDRAAEKGFERIEDMAEAFGISRQSLSALLNHKNLPSLQTADRIARVLGVKVQDLYDGRA